MTRGNVIINLRNRNVIISTATVVLVLLLVAIWHFVIKPISIQNELANQKDKEIYVQDEIVVKFKQKAEPELIKVSVGQVEAEVARYQQMDNVDYAEPNYLAEIAAISSDLLNPQQWNLQDYKSGGINIEPAWDLTAVSVQRDVVQGNEVVVAVVDTGIAYEDYTETVSLNIGPRVIKYYQAPALIGTCFVPGYDFLGNDKHANDGNGHGTAIASIIAANGQGGVTGIAPDACLMPIKVFNNSGRGAHSNIADGIRWAIDHGARIINLGFTTIINSHTLYNAVLYAWSYGATIVAPMGNAAFGSAEYPAAYDNLVISVGATQKNKTLARYSNYGKSADLVAPGGMTQLNKADGILVNTFAEDISSQSDDAESTDNNRYRLFAYKSMAGTSLAAAHVSGVLALLFSGNRKIDPVLAEEILSASAKNLGKAGWDEKFGWGLLDAEAAVDLLFYPKAKSDDLTIEGFWNASGVKCPFKSQMGNEDLCDPAKYPSIKFVSRHNEPFVCTVLNKYPVFLPDFPPLKLDDQSTKQISQFPTGYFIEPDVVDLWDGICQNFWEGLSSSVSFLNVKKGLSFLAGDEEFTTDIQKSIEDIRQWQGISN